MRLRTLYLLMVVGLFLLEVLIAGAMPGGFVRGSLGDVFVIALIYFFLRGVFNIGPRLACALSIAAGFLAETLQAFHLAELLGFQKGSIPYVLLGNTFSTLDLAMYVVGGLLAFALDFWLIRTWSSHS